MMHIVDLVAVIRQRVGFLLIVVGRLLHFERY